MLNPTPAIQRALAGEFEEIHLRPSLSEEAITVGLTVEDAAQGAVVVFTELAKNAGRSITSAAEFLADTIYRNRLSHHHPGQVQFFERYGDISYPVALGQPDSVSRVAFQFTSTKFARPIWAPVEVAPAVTQLASAA